MRTRTRRWTADEAIEFVRLVEGADLHWFEEPCRWDTDRVSLRDVRMKTGARVCAGQSEYSAAGCRELMAAGAIDVCNFDASWSGGPTEWRRVAAIAASYGLAMGHHEEPQVASHLLASIPHGTFVECFHPDRDPIWWNLPANRPQLRDGILRLSEQPGLGWELDEDYIERYRVVEAVDVMAGIRFSGVTKQFDDGTVAVDDLDLEINDGEFMIFVGPSGCGKTTALRMVAGLEHPTAGEILIGGKVVNDLDPVDRDIAMVFQNYALYPHMTVRDNIGFPLKMQKLDKEERRRRIRTRPSCSASTSCSSASPARSRAASGSGWRWAARSSATRRHS